MSILRETKNIGRVPVIGYQQFRVSLRVCELRTCQGPQGAIDTEVWDSPIFHVACCNYHSADDPVITNRARIGRQVKLVNCCSSFSSSIKLIL